MFNYLGFILLLKLCSSHDASTVKDIDNGSELLGLSKQSQQQRESQLAAQDGVRDSITKLPGPHLQSQVVAKSGVETNINEPHLKSSYFSNTNLKNSVSDIKIMQLTAENVVINKTSMLPASPSSSSLVSSVENSAITQTEPVTIENSNSYSGVLSSNLHSSTSASVFSTDGTHILITSTPSMPVKLSSTSSALSKRNSNTVTVHLNSKSSSSTPSISMTSDLSPSNTQISAMPLASASSAIPMTNGSSIATKLSSVLPTLSSMEKIANATSILVTTPVLTQILTASSSPSTPVPSSIHWKTVTVCPWDSLYPASAVQSVITSSQESLSSNLSLASTASLSTMITPIILSSAISESSVITQSHVITQSSVISPSAAWTPILVPSYSVISNQSDIKPIARKGCRVVLDGLSQAMGNMTFCILNNLIPLEVCGKCTKVYSEMQEYQSLIAKTANCENELVLEFNSQYQAIPKMYAFQNDLWNDFECEKCYEERPTGTPYAPWNPRSQFAQSAVLVKQIMTCFANYSNGISVPYPVMLNVSQRINSTSWKSTTQICSKCKHLYREIKKYMKSIHYEGSADKRWCADMVYGFNETRRIWGAICVPEKKNSESIIALTCFFCFIPVIFYIGTKLHSDVKERKNDSRVNYESE